MNNDYSSLIPAIYVLGVLIVATILGISIIIYLAKRALKKDFLNNFGISFDDRNAMYNVEKKLSGKEEEIDDKIVKAIEVLKSLNPPEHSPFFSWFNYWADQDSKVREKERELRELEKLAERLGLKRIPK